MIVSVPFTLVWLFPRRAAAICGTSCCPAVTLGMNRLAIIARLITRSSKLEVLGQDYVRTARAKGLAWWVLRGAATR